MGLDVHLYTRAQHRQNEAYSATFDIEDEDAATAARALLPNDGYSLAEEVASRAYPGHLFNRRYLRSSYNASGFDRIVPTLLGDPNVTLEGLFAPVHQPDRYETVLAAKHVDGLREVAKRALGVASMLSACNPLITGTTGPLIGSAEHLWDRLPDESQVLEWAREELAKEKHTFHSYETAKGSIYGDGLEVVAITAGQSYRRPVAIYVYRMSQEALDTYVQSAEIVAEFCEEAIDLIERDGSCVLSWSG